MSEVQPKLRCSKTSASVVWKKRGKENSVVWSFAAPGLSRPGLAVSEKEARSRVVEKKTPTAVISLSTDVDKFVLSFMIE